MEMNQQNSDGAVGLSVPIWPPQVSWFQWPARKTEEGSSVILKGTVGDLRALWNKCVVVFGLGAVGGVVLQTLARSGVGTLIGVDPDNYGCHSWRTQPIQRADQGLSKAAVQGAAAARINPASTIFTGVGCAQDVPWLALCQADCLVVAGDNRELPVWAGMAGTRWGKPVIQGAVHGQTDTVIVRAYDRTDPAAACPGCAMGSSEWATLKSRAGCDASRPHLLASEPTATPPTVCSTAGQLVAHEVLKQLLRTGDRLTDEELTISLFSYRAYRTRLQRNEHCRCSHTPATTVTRRLVAPARLGEVIEQLGCRPEQAQVTAEQLWLCTAQCTACYRSWPRHQFGRLGQEVSRCDCGGCVVMDSPGLQSAMPSSDLQRFSSRTLAELGLGPGAGLAVWDGESWIHAFVVGDLADVCAAQRSVAAEGLGDGSS